MRTPRESGSELFRREYDLDEVARMRPVLRLTNLILAEAIAQGAAGIRLQSREADTGAVEYSLQGEWRQVMRIPIKAFGPLLNRFRVMAALDIAKVPRQEGEVHVRTKGSPYRFSIRSEVPSGGPESID